MQLAAQPPSAPDVVLPEKEEKRPGDKSEEDCKSFELPRVFGVCEIYEYL